MKEKPVWSKANISFQFKKQYKIDYNSSCYFIIYIKHIYMYYIYVCFRFIGYMYRFIKWVYCMMLRFGLLIILLPK